MSEDEAEINKYSHCEMAKRLASILDSLRPQLGSLPDYRDKAFDTQISVLSHYVEVPVGVEQ